MAQLNAPVPDPAVVAAVQAEQEAYFPVNKNLWFYCTQCHRHMQAKYYHPWCEASKAPPPQSALVFLEAGGAAAVKAAVAEHVAAEFAAKVAANAAAASKALELESQLKALQEKLALMEQPITPSAPCPVCKVSIPHAEAAAHMASHISAEDGFSSAALALAVPFQAGHPSQPQVDAGARDVVMRKAREELARLVRHMSVVAEHILPSASGEDRWAALAAVFAKLDSAVIYHSQFAGAKHVTEARQNLRVSERWELLAPSTGVESLAFQQALSDLRHQESVWDKMTKESGGASANPRSANPSGSSCVIIDGREDEPDMTPSQRGVLINHSGSVWSLVFGHRVTRLASIKDWQSVSKSNSSIAGLWSLARQLSVSPVIAGSPGIQGHLRTQLSVCDFIALKAPRATAGAGTSEKECPLTAVLMQGLVPSWSELTNGESPDFVTMFTELGKLRGWFELAFPPMNSLAGDMAEIVEHFRNLNAVTTGPFASDSFAEALEHSRTAWRQTVLDYNRCLTASVRAVARSTLHSTAAASTAALFRAEVPSLDREFQMQLITAQQADRALRQSINRARHTNSQAGNSLMVTLVNGSQVPAGGVATASGNSKKRGFAAALHEDGGASGTRGGDDLKARRTAVGESAGLSLGICKYYATGASCNRGDSCRYRHGGE